MGSEFEADWSRVRGDVYAYCLRAAGGNVVLAEEAFRATARRLQRGYRSFRDADEFLPWAQSHARAEVCRLAYARIAAPRPPASADLRGPWMEMAAAAAVAEGWLSDGDARLLTVRAANPGFDWSRIGAVVELTGPLAAARHARTAGRLWVFLFTRRPDLLGPPEVLRDAFERAVADPLDPLPPPQADVMRALVFDRPPADPRRPGWRDDLAAACERVARFLPLP